MSASLKTIKILWAAAAGQCAFPDCRKRLCITEAGGAAPYVIGEMAHICGEKTGANRYDVNQTPKQRDDYANLILLCPTHHTLIDKRENENVYEVEILQQIKANHEAYIRSRLVKSPADKTDAVRMITPLLADNHAVWLNYGPLSDLARKKPHSDEAHAVWISERLSTIVPNNRRICEILRLSRGHFTSSEQQLIASFFLHARSYERWVEDEISYEAVVCFPLEFDEMIKGIANASR